MGLDLRPFSCHVCFSCWSSTRCCATSTTLSRGQHLMMHLWRPESSPPSLPFPAVPNSPAPAEKQPRDLVKIPKCSAAAAQRSWSEAEASKSL